MPKLRSFGIIAPSDLHKVTIALSNETTIEYNGGTNLVCYTDSNSSPLKWTKTTPKGQSVSIGGIKTTQRLKGKQSIIKLRNVTKDDEGIYTCSLNVGGRLKTASVKVNVKGMSSSETISY